jgi:hypothetical protein
MRSTLILFLSAILLLPAAGCYKSGVGTSDVEDDDGSGPDLPDAAQDPVPDPVEVNDPDMHVDPMPDPVTDVMVDVEDRCRPQEAYEDPEIDCDGCNPCDPTPYQWTGGRCAFLPICCMCAGADCDSRFVTLTACLDAYRDCPRVPEEPPRYPWARLLWQAPGGFAGTGPVLLLDGMGSARIWTQDRGLYSVDSEEWSRTDYDAAESIGAAAAEELFDMLLSVSYTDLPHPPTGWNECYPTLEFRACEGCETVRLDYSQARDLLPEFWSIYAWVDERLCRSTPAGTLPRAYCEFF